MPTHMAIFALVSLLNENITIPKRCVQTRVCVCVFVCSSPAADEDTTSCQARENAACQKRRNYTYFNVTMDSSRRNSNEWNREDEILCVLCGWLRLPGILFLRAAKIKGNPFWVSRTGAVSGQLTPGQGRFLYDSRISNLNCPKDVFSLK